MYCFHIFGVKNRLLMPRHHKSDKMALWQILCLLISYYKKTCTEILPPTQVYCMSKTTRQPDKNPFQKSLYPTTFFSSPMYCMIVKMECFVNTPLNLHILKLVIFTFSCSFRFFLTSYAWFLVMFSFTNLLLDTSFCAISLKSS